MMVSSDELVPIINALSGANRRNLVVFGSRPAMAEAYNMALVDVLTAVDEVQAATQLQIKLDKHLLLLVHCD